MLSSSRVFLHFVMVKIVDIQCLTKYEWMLILFLEQKWGYVIIATYKRFWQMIFGEMPHLKSYCIVLID